ncbi:MAG TPA: hypothetical protein VEH30_02525 [Terriglobales bacterium]|nr:hypothetical protein [Terriglobales bacterium]
MNRRGDARADSAHIAGIQRAQHLEEHGTPVRTDKRDGLANANPGAEFKADVFFPL